ncbi:MAG TPA: endonuclease/exonuclease/phosphatase family protein [Candidatus Paceibacterota bacterium]|nr:endonuclease/exonuclease/phosphatase family protein [Candidatus Paceibacterota bacterium]
MHIRIVVVNIQSGIGVTEGYRQYLTSGWRYLLPHRGRGVMGAGTFLKAEDTDIALLTEVDGGSRRSRHSSQMDAIAKESGMEHAHFFPARIVGTSIREGNAIMSRFPMHDIQAYPLVSRVNPRVLGKTTLTLPNGKVLHAFVAHLALGARAREIQLREILEHIRSVEGPVLLGGDFNERDHRSFAQLKKAGLMPVSVPGYPSWKPQHALQVLFMSHHLTLSRASVPTGARFSDHLPLMVEVEMD